LAPRSSPQSSQPPGGVWRLVAAAAGDPLSRRTAVELSLAKLFADQTLPSAGLSSSVLVAKALEQRRVAPGGASKRDADVRQHPQIHSDDDERQSRKHGEHGGTMALIPFAFAIPYLPFARVFGFVRLPGALVATVAAITAAYVAATELQKRWFYRRAA